MPGSSSPDYLPKSVSPYFEHLRSTLSPEDLKVILEEFRSDWTATSDKPDGHPLPGADLHWEAWLAFNFPAVASYPPSQRHIRLWEWLEKLSPGYRPRSFVAGWPRAGAKSTTVELGCARLCVKLTRRFVLYVSETQAQANKHVQAVATNLERLGVERSINQYGASRGWKMDLLRTANGFNVIAFGLDAGARGVKLDQYRPDLIVLDDIDGLHDTEETREKKRETITSTVLPAGSEDAAVLFVQNLITDVSLMSEQVDGSADWLLDKEPVSVEPAIVGMEVESVPGEDGINRWRISAGTPTWEGQSLAVCEMLLNRIGLAAFERECQHKVEGAQGIFFHTDRLSYIDPEEVPKGLRWCRAWDRAATEGGGDWTAGLLMGMQGDYPNVWAYVVDLDYGQWSAETVRGTIKRIAKKDGSRVWLRLTQDPAQAGKDQADQDRRELLEFYPRIRLATGKKWDRARGFAECVNRGNVFVVRGDWNRFLTDRMKKFKEGVLDQDDDPIDAAADAFNELALFPEERPKEKEADQSWLPEALRTAPRPQVGDGLVTVEGWNGRSSYEEW
jgi:predicted phage terminase large subunit-like protein